MSKERLFFALWPSETVRQALRPAAESVRQVAVDGRTVPDESLHITLRFMGSLTPDEWQAAERAAERVRHRDISLRLDRAGFWSQTRILWIGCGDVPDSILGLLADLNTELGGEGFDLKSRPYRPHVTVARGVSDVEPLPSIAPIQWDVADFVLVRSELGEPQPAYEIVGRWPLRAE